MHLLEGFLGGKDGKSPWSCDHEQVGEGYESLFCAVVITGSAPLTL